MAERKGTTRAEDEEDARQAGEGEGGGGGGERGEAEELVFAFLKGEGDGEVLASLKEKGGTRDLPYSTLNSGETKWVIDETKLEEEEGLYYYRKPTGITKDGDPKGAKEDMGRLVETWIRVCIFHEIKKILKKRDIDAYVIEGSPTAVHDIDVNHFFMPESGGGGGGGDDELMRKNTLMKDILVKLIGHGISVKAFGGGSWPLGDLARQFDNARDKFIFVIVEYESQTKTKNKFSNVTALNICESDPDGKNLFNLKGEQLKKMQDDFFLTQRWGGFLLKRLRVKKKWAEASPNWKFSKAVTEKYKGKKLVEFARSCPASREEKLLWKIKNYTSSDELAKQYLLIKAGKDKDGVSYFKRAIDANQIYKMVLYWIVYYGNLITIRKITNKKPHTNKMIIFKSFFNHAGGHSEQKIIQVLRQCEFAPPNPNLFVNSKLYRVFAERVAGLWDASPPTEKLPSWLGELDFQPDGNLDTAKRPGSIWANEGVFIKKTGVNVASKWNTTSTVRFPQFGMNRAKFIKTMGQSVNRFSDEKESTLFQIFKKTCRFQLNRTEFAKYTESMKEREIAIRSKEENLKQGVQGGGGRRDYKQFIIQTGGGKKADEIAARADFAEVALLEEEEAQQRIHDIEEDEQIAAADAEIRDIKNEEVQKILAAEHQLAGLAAEEQAAAVAGLEAGLEAAARLAHRERVAAEAEAAEEVMEAAAIVELKKTEIEDKIKGLSEGEKKEVKTEFTGRLEEPMEELQIKVHKALELRCEEIKQAPENRGERRARRLADPTQAARRAKRGLDECERVGELYKAYNASDIIDLEKISTRNIGYGSVRRILWDIFKENKLIIKKIELNHGVAASLSEFASDDGGGGAGAAAPPAPPAPPPPIFPTGLGLRRRKGPKGSEGGRRTRRKRKKRKKRKKRTRRK